MLLLCILHVLMVVRASILHKHALAGERDLEMRLDRWSSTRKKPGESLETDQHYTIGPFPLPQDAIAHKHLRAKVISRKPTDITKSTHIVRVSRRAYFYPLHDSTSHQDNRPLKTSVALLVGKPPTTTHLMHAACCSESKYLHRGSSLSYLTSAKEHGPHSSPIPCKQHSRLFDCTKLLEKRLSWAGEAIRYL